MNELFVMNYSSVRQIRRAVAVMTCLSMLTCGGNAAQAALWPFSLINKSAKGPDLKGDADSKKDADPKSKAGVSTAIRKLMMEAKDQEAMGNLDRAIALADRAAKMSQSSSNVAKTVPDVSPLATARYANELHLKKAEQSVTKKGKTPKQGNSLDPDRPPSETKSLAKANPPKVKTPALAGRTEKNADRDAVEKKGVKTATLAAAEPPKPRTTAVESAEDPLVADFVPAAPSVAKSRQSTAAPSPPEFAFDDEGSVTTVAADRATKSPWDEKAGSTTQVSFDDEEPPTVTPMPPSSTLERARNTSTSSDSAPLKLRQLYSMNEPDQTLLPAGTADSRTEFEGEPTITPMTSQPDDDDSAFSQPKKRAPIATEDNVTTMNGSEYIDQLNEPKTWDEESNPVDQKSGSWDDSVEKRADGSSNKNVPGDKGEDLEHQLELAASLEPGAVAPYLKSNREAQLSAAEVEEKMTVLRLRKRRLRSRELAGPTPISNPVGAGRPSAVGQTSIVLWRPVKDATDIPVREHQPESKPVRLPEDLRESLRDITSLTLNSPAIHSNSSPQSRNALWDNATAPSNEQHAGAIAAAAKPIQLNRAASNTAPKPPRGAVEQVSFDASTEMLDRRSHAEFDLNSTPVPSSSDGFDFAPGSLLNSESESSLNSQVGSIQPNPQNGPVGRLALLFGVSESKMLSILGIAGFAMVLASLWTVRAVARSKHV